jgi:hypothetical protein
MYELINLLVKSQEKDAVRSKAKPRDAQSLRRAITELAAQENAKVPVERRVTQRDIEVVAARSLNKTVGLERASRFFAAYKEVASFVTLATTGKNQFEITQNRDLLAIGHPLSTRTHAMTASAYSEAVARWIAADPRIADEARPIVAAVYMTGFGSVDYEHAVARLAALPAGLVPQEFVIDAQLQPITASFMGWLRSIFGGGNSSIARSRRAKKQLRDRDGQFAEQGGGMQFYVSMPDGTYKSKVGSHAGNAENGTDFLVEVSGDPDLPDGIYQVPASMTMAVEAIIPGDDAGAVSLPEGVEAVNLADMKAKDVPDGWKLVREKGEGETGPDKVYATDDGYEVEVFEAGNYTNADLQKAYQFNKGIMTQVPGMPVGNFTERVDAAGRPNMKAKFDSKKPVYNLYRVETPETQRQAVVMAQRWSDIQEFAEADQDKFEKYYDAAEKVNAEKKTKQEKAAAESKAQNEAAKKTAEEQFKKNEENKAIARANLDKGLDPFGNEIPEGWTPIIDEEALKPSEYKGQVNVQPFSKAEATKFFSRFEQGVREQLRQFDDGTFLDVKNNNIPNWDEANKSFENRIKERIAQIRKDAADHIAQYDDENGTAAKMLEDGASGEEIRAELAKNPAWKAAKEDLDTSWAVDLPQPAQKEKWAKFGKGIDAINQMPLEFKPLAGQEVKAELPEQTTKKASDLEVGDVIVDSKGKPQTIEKISSVDSGTMVSFRDPETKKMKFKTFEDPNEDVKVQPLSKEERREKAAERYKDSPVPIPVPKEERREKAAEPYKNMPKADDIDWILPDGAFKLYKADEYEPEGRIDEESSDFTDDPKVLANKFSSEQLKDALAQAIIGVKDFATEFLDELKDLDDEDEEEGTKKKPGPKKKKIKINKATGYGQLDFAFGDENVPAEAIYSALKEQGIDVDMLAAEIYDLPTGESKNVDMLEGLRSPEDVKAQEPSVLLDDFDKDAMDIISLNEDVAKQDAAAVAVAQINDAKAAGEDNVFIRDVAVDINSLKSPTNLSSFLGKYIGWAISGSGDEKQAFRSLWGLLLSADGGYTKPGVDDSMLFNAVSDAMQSYNGTEPSIEEVEAVFKEFGYFENLVRSKSKVANGEETLDMDESLAGSMYRLLASMSTSNTVSLYRGIQIPLDSEGLDLYEEGQVLSLDPRSFSDDKALAGKFAGAFGGNEDKAAVIFTIPAGKGSVAKIDNVSMFEEEREQLAWGNYRIVKVGKKVNAAGKTLYNVELEALDKRGEVLEGLNNDYDSLLIDNEQIDLPTEYYSIAPAPFENVDTESLEDADEIDAALTNNPLYIARAYEMEDLIAAFRGSIEDGTGKIQLIDDKKEYTVDAEAVRDALQIQGINTNEVLKDIANTEEDVEATEVDAEAITPVADSPLAGIIEEFGEEYDLEGFEQTGPQQGSNQGGTFKDAEGNEYYVKSPKSELHRRNELLASAFYKLAGVNAAEMRFGSADDGQEKIFSSIIPGSTLGDTDLTPETKKQIQEGFAIDAWLANWDVAGLVNDNIIIDEDGDAFRIDTGGALLFRAMGSPKGSAFGNEVTELDTLRNSSMNPTSAALFGDMADEDLKASASKLLDISHSDIDDLVDSTLGDSPEADELKDKLKARRQFILEKYNLLGDDTSLIAETAKVEDEEQEVPAVEVEQPVTPKPEIPSEDPGNPYVTSDGVPIEPGMQVRHKKTGEVGTVIKYDKGNSNYVYVQGEDGTIKNKSTKQLESLNKDDNGDGGDGGGPKDEDPQPEKPSPTDESTQTEQTDKPKVIDTTGTVEAAVKDIQSAIDNSQLISFYYNGKIRTMKPMSIWENQKNGKINVYGEDLGDDSKKKNFTVQQMQEIPDGSKPEAVTAEEPIAEPKKLQLHAQWIKDLVAQQGKTITDEQAVQIRDMIEQNDLLGMNWSAAEDSDLIEAITEAVGADLSGLGDDGDDDEIDVQPEILPEPQAEAKVDEPFGNEVALNKAADLVVKTFENGFTPEGKIIAVNESDGTIAITPDGEQVYIFDGKKNTSFISPADPAFFGPDGDGGQVFKWRPLSEEENNALLKKIADNAVPYGTPKNEGPSEGDEAETETEAPTLEPGAEVTDKKGNKGTVLKGPNKDNYVFVQFEDGKTGWRSAGSVSTTGEFNESIKKAAPKATPGKMTPAGTKAVFVENPAGWDTSEFENVPALSDAIALVQNPDDKFAAMKGASAAIDADSIEDLDVRIMRVRDKEGTDGLRLKFKLTSWAGNARVKEIMEMTPEQREAEGITKGQMVVDRIDVGADGVGQISKDKNSYQGDGVTWTITTPEGVVIKIYRGNYDATSKLSSSKYGQPRAFHNLVQIQAPADVTNEQIADALKKAGVSDVRPATPADSRILVENRLMSIFDGKVDATKNPKGADREASLQRIKDKYGITPDDVIVTTGASGRIETRLSPEGAQKIVTATGSPTAIKHNITVPGFYGSSGTPEEQFELRTDWLSKLIGTPQGGLLSTTTRWTEGIGASGMSSSADVGTGGADYVFTKPVKITDAKEFGTNGVVMYFDPVKLYQRLDFYANSGDNFGKRQVNQDVINAAKVGAYELMFKHRISFDDLDSIVVANQATRTAVIQKLRQMGIDQIGGRPLEAVIIIGSQVNPN